MGKKPSKQELFENLSLELRRGALTLAVLSQLQEERYGYDLKQSLDEQGLEINEGTLYPLLRRLEKQGLSSASRHTLSLTVNALHTFYCPTEEELAFISTHARGDAQHASPRESEQVGQIVGAFSADTGHGEQSGDADRRPVDRACIGRRQRRPPRQPSNARQSCRGRQASR